MINLNDLSKGTRNIVGSNPFSIIDNARLRQFNDELVEKKSLIWLLDRLINDNNKNEEAMWMKNSEDTSSILNESRVVKMMVEKEIKCLESILSDSCWNKLKGTKYAN
jgi:hypothetical protein